MGEDRTEADEFEAFLLTLTLTLTLDFGLDHGERVDLVPCDVQAVGLVTWQRVSEERFLVLRSAQEVDLACIGSGSRLFFLIVIASQIAAKIDLPLIINDRVLYSETASLLNCFPFLLLEHPHHPRVVEVLSWDFRTAGVGSHSDQHRFVLAVNGVGSGCLLIRRMAWLGLTLQHWSLPMLDTLSLNLRRLRMRRVKMRRSVRVRMGMSWINIGLWSVRLQIGMVGEIHKIRMFILIVVVAPSGIVEIKTISLGPPLQ